MTATVPPHRISPFTPVPVRERAVGWTPLKQAEFIGMLAETGSVAAAAWDAALVAGGVRRVPVEQRRSRKVT